MINGLVTSGWAWRCEKCQFTDITPYDKLMRDSVDRARPPAGWSAVLVFGENYHDDGQTVLCPSCTLGSTS